MVTHDLAGAATLIDNYVFAYRCAARQVANGRQHFEVPSMLVGVGGAVAAAFGAPAGYAIATGATVATTNSLKSYYAPRDKLPVLTASVDALSCIQTVSVGLKAYGSSLIDKKADEAPVSVIGGTAAKEGASIAVGVTTQYFRLIQSALMQVENITAQRLSSIGAYSPDALMTEIKALIAKEEAAKAELEKKKREAEATAETITGTPPVQPAPTDVVEVEVEGEADPVLIESQSLEALLNEDGTLADSVTETMKQSATTKKGLFLKKNNAGSPFIAKLNDKQKTAVADKTKSEAATDAVKTSLIYLEAMQPELQQCIVRAKL